MALGGVVPALFRRNARARVSDPASERGVGRGSSIQLEEMQSRRSADLPPGGVGVGGWVWWGGGVIEGGAVVRTRKHGVGRLHPKGAGCAPANAYSGALLRARTPLMTVIVSEPSNPWVARGGVLFSREFLGGCARQAHSRGVLLPVYTATRTGPEAVAARAQDLRHRVRPRGSRSVKQRDNVAGFAPRSRIFARDLAAARKLD